MEFLDTYTSELVLGGGSALGSLVIAILKKFSNRIVKMEEKIQELEKKIEINTALDRERAKKN